MGADRKNHETFKVDVSAGDVAASSPKLRLREVAVRSAAPDCRGVR